MNSNDFQPTAAPVARLIQQFHKLPGIGSKSAQRLAYYLIRMPEQEARGLAEAIVDVKDNYILLVVSKPYRKQPLFNLFRSKP